MPIFDQGYQHWNGHLASQFWRWWAITRQGVRAQLKNKFTRLWMIVCFGPALALVTFMILWSLLEQGNQSIQTVLQFLPEQFRQIPKEYRLTVWTLAYHIFFMAQVFLLMVLVLLIGPGLISNDLRFNALPLYLSRPVRRSEYFFGKLGVIGLFVLIVTAAPATLAWLLGVLFSLNFSAVVELFPLLLGSWAISLIVAIVFGLWMLALSSLSRNSRYVSMMWFGWWLVTSMLSNVLFNVVRGEEWPLVIGFTRNVQRMQEYFLDTETAWAKVDEAYHKTMQQGSRMVQNFPGGRRMLPNQPQAFPEDKPRRIGLITTLRPISRPPNPDPPAATNNTNPPDQARPPRGAGPEPDWELQERSGPFRSIYPWTWSAAVLAGLGVLSLCMLTFRVRSLDRLR